MLELAIIFGLLSAAAWGCGDFVAGFASRVNHRYQVVACVTIVSLLIYVGLALLTSEALPSKTDFLWAIASGIASTIGLAALYRGIALGKTATVTPIAGVIGAALPILFSLLTSGVLAANTSIGILLSVIGLWLITKPTQGIASVDRSALILGVSAGLGFGLFFILIAQVDKAFVYWPLTSTRIGILLFILVLLKSNKLPISPRHKLHYSLIAGLLDCIGALLFVFASHNARVDVAAALSSLYPVATILCATLVARETVSRSQWFGITVCFCGVMILSL